MREETLRAVLMVRAIEEVDRAGTILPPGDRAQATREAVRALGLPADVAARLAKGKLRLHGWVYHIGSSEILVWNRETHRFGRIDGGERLRLEPVIPEDWNGFEIRYRHRETPYRIRVRAVEADAEPALRLDGVASPDGAVTLVDDRGEHEIQLDWPRRGLKRPESVLTISTRQ